MFVKGDLVPAVAAMGQHLPPLLESKKRILDQTELAKVAFMLIGWDNLFSDTLLSLPDFSWKTWLTSEDMRWYMRYYNFAVHHEVMSGLNGMDHSSIAPVGQTVTLRYGCLELQHEAVAFHEDTWRKMLQLPDQRTELYGYSFMTAGPCALTYYMYGHCKQGTAIFKEARSSWYDAEAFAVDLLVGMPGLQPPDSTECVSPVGVPYIRKYNDLTFTMKACFLLVSQCKEQSKAEILEWLPSAPDLVKQICITEQVGNAMGFLSSSALMAALICEILHEPARALDYLGVVIPDCPSDSYSTGGWKPLTSTTLTEFVRSGGDPKLTSWCFGACCRGRVYASLGQTQNAIDSCELASAIAESSEFWLLQALALRDMWMATTAGFHRVACERRLGVCLRKLTEGQPTELDRFLNTSFACVYSQRLNFDSASLMAACL